jgi:hypothetical protein
MPKGMDRNSLFRLDQIQHLLATLFSCDIGSYAVGKG